MARTNFCQLSGVLIQYVGLLSRLVVLHLLMELLLLRRGEVPGHLVEAELEQLEDAENLLSPLWVLDHVHDLLRVLSQEICHLPRVDLDQGNCDRVEIIWA